MPELSAKAVLFRARTGNRSADKVAEMHQAAVHVFVWLDACDRKPGLNGYDKIN